MALGGFKDFTAEAATSGDVDAYLMQGILVFASTAARDSALSSFLEEGRFCYVKDTNAMYYYTGSAWVPFMTQWATYTPAWTNLTPNSGTLDFARYRYIMGDLRVRGQFTFAADTAVTGAISQTLPDSKTSDAGWAGGVGLGRDDSGNVFEQCIIGITPSATTFAWVTTSGELVSNTVPWTWAVSDLITWDFTIAVA